MSRKVKLLIAAPIVLVALVLGGTWVYLNVVEGDPPAELSLRDNPAQTQRPAATGGPVEVDGRWVLTEESQVGYRVQEVLFGQDTTAVGRTNKVTGSLTVAGPKVTTTEFVVDMASVASDRERRDGQYRERIMDTATYPTATFVLTKPIDLGQVPADGATVDAKAAGRLTLRGQTKDVAFDVRARRTGARIEVSGAIPIVFAEWGIPDPSFGPAQVADQGELEFLLVFAK